MKEGAPKSENQKGFFSELKDAAIDGARVGWISARFEIFLREHATDVIEDIRMINQLLGSGYVDNTNESPDDLKRELSTARKSKIEELQRIQALVDDKERMARIVSLARQWKSQSS